MRRAASLLASSLVALAVAGSVAAVPERSQSVRFRAATQHVLPGDMAFASVSVRPSRVRCSLSVRYSDGQTQSVGPARATRGRATWKWRVPEGAAAGAARLTASCARAGRGSRAMVVVGDVLAPKISVEQQGFSIRPKRTRGTDVSYGLILKNESPNRDAVGITVLVNFVDERNILFGSATSRVSAIAAGSRYALGGTLAFPAAAPVARLEVVAQVQSHTPRLLHLPPVENVRVLPDLTDFGWVGSVEGEMINDHPRLILARSRLSAVILDPLGNIVGGTTGMASASLPPGARQFFKLTRGVNPIPLFSAASALVSVEPSYEHPR